jgi:regulator of protease activity HflC (stomatin/prohibitin superfamily)
MSLRSRQIGGIPLNKGDAFFVTLLVSLFIPLLAYTFWFPLFRVPEELRKGIVFLGMVSYYAQSMGIVPVGMERAQLFFGTYTGRSFSAGFYFLPKLPFPIILLFVYLFLPENKRRYLGWILEGDVGVESFVTSFSAEGLTSDGVRVSLKGTLVFEVENAAIFLSQKMDTQNRSSVEQALASISSSCIKEKVIANYTAKNLLQGNCGGSSINEWITDACFFVQDFGLSLARSPITSVTIESKTVEKVFDRVQAKELFRENTNEIAEAFGEFRKKLPEDTSEELAFSMFNYDRIDNGAPPVSINVLKLK